MQKRIIPVLLAGLLFGACASSIAATAAPAKKVWITLGDAAYSQLQKLAPQAIAKTSQLVSQSSTLATQERVHLVEVDEQQLLGLSNAIHRDLNRCGGFVFHPNEAAGMAALAPKAASLLAAVRPSYVIDNQATVNAYLPQMQDNNIGQTIIDLSNFTNRYYTTTGGVNASTWLLQRWQALAAGRSDISVAQFTHASWAQKSVIMTIQGTDNASEVVVLGGHLDSINQAGTTETTRAPGADDDASGVASLTEVIRVMVANGYKPRRTIKFIAYSAEEVGLRGSAEIAANFKTNNINVVGVMQLDMTNYKGAANDIYIFDDYTDSGQNQFVANLISTYLPTLTVGHDKCGYGCSDHASWNAQGYYTSMPFEASFAGDNKAIHSANDTYANTGSQALHALKFSRMAMAYAVELGSDAGAPPPPPDKTETFTGSLAKGVKKSFGPFKVAIGGTFAASTTGTGDIDLYVRKTSVPTTTTADCKSEGSTSTEKCSITMTANGDVYVLLNGYAAGNYTLKATYRPQ